MIKICNEKYTGPNLYDCGLVLSDFQKYSIEALHNGHNSLVIAGTGSGKTLSVHYAIDHFINKNKKRVFYISPIKALSNQKYNEFKNKFKDTSIGILTGDIKCNPVADCIIMTCEILRNYLKTGTNNDLTLDNVACIVFDEIHYINDKHRGTVWEETLILLRELNIQFLMLSATIDKPEIFGQWISNLTHKDTWISGYQKRIVPLIHMSLVFVKDKIIKDDKTLKNFSNINKFIIKDDNLNFNTENYNKVNLICDTLNKNYNTNKYSKKYIINETVSYLNKNNMLPAIYFNLSKDNIMQCIEDVTTINFNTDVKNNEIKNQCNNILKKLPNYKDFIELPQYEKLLKCLERGIAYHHSGLISIFREMVEILFEKGYIKLLFCTETFSVGLNMPTKTVVFDSLVKYDGEKFRYLLSHEYNQMAGRAGRRGIDTLGYVVHLNNLFKDTIDTESMKNIMSAEPLVLNSKFKINYSLVLSTINNKIGSHYDLMKNSMLNDELKTIKTNLEQDLKIEESKLSDFNSLKDDKNKKNKKNKKISAFNFIEKASVIDTIKNNIKDIDNYFNNALNGLKQGLIKHDFITIKDNVEILTIKGTIASKMKDFDIYLTDLILSIKDDLLSDILATLGCVIIKEFNFKNDDFETINFKNKKIIENLIEQYGQMLDDDHRINYGSYDLILQWIECKDNTSCINVLESVDSGTFVKGIISLNNFVEELVKIEELGIDYCHKLSETPSLLLKHVVLNQSLYI